MPRTGPRPNEAPVGADRIGTGQWHTWAEVPAAPPEFGKFFLDIFAGTARLTNTMRTHGWQCLPPIELETNEEVLQGTDLLELDFGAKVRRWLNSGVVRLVHFGTPCTTYSQARRDDGGPRPLRSTEHIRGLPGLTKDEQEYTDMGTALMEATCSLIRCMHSTCHWTIENPAGSMLWITPELKNLAAEQGSHRVEYDCCAFGCEYRKPSALLCSAAAFCTVSRTCPGTTTVHRHLELTGKEWNVHLKRMVYKTKRAQEYPWALCTAYAEAAGTLQPRQHGSCAAGAPELGADLNAPEHADKNAPSFKMTVPAHERKRALGTDYTKKDHRQKKTAAQAVAAGTQMKKRRSAAPPENGV